MECLKYEFESHKLQIVQFFLKLFFYLNKQQFSLVSITRLRKIYVDEGSRQSLRDSSWNFGTYRICEQRRVRWACTFVQYHHSLCCSNWKRSDVDEGPGPILSLLRRWFCCCWFIFLCSSHWMVEALCLVLVLLCINEFFNHLVEEEWAWFFTFTVFLRLVFCCCSSRCHVFVWGV